MDKMKLGENMNQEYSWSHDIEELIVQFNFQLVRGGEDSLKDKYQIILKKIFGNEFVNKEYVDIIYRLIGYTRDIVNGKGEYTLSYMLISEFYKFSETEDCPANNKYKIRAMAMSALESFVKINLNEHAYGSWKDLKYFCNYHITQSNRNDPTMRRINDPFFNKAISLMCGQIQCDEKAPIKTLAAKWIPREKSRKFGWITNYLAIKYYNKWITPNLTNGQYKIAKRKCLTHFRQLISKINKNISTPQINQCNGDWSNINFEKNVTSITHRKQSKAFQGIDKEGNPRKEIVNNEDRMKCIKNYREYVERCKEGKSIVKGKRVSMHDFVKDAVNVKTEEEKIILNCQWEENGKENGNLENYIAMVDTSENMETENYVPLYSAIGLGLRIAEKSKLGRRILTFNSSPEWISLNDTQDLTSMVSKVKESSFGMNTNFREALNMILECAINNNISPINMKDMTLVILSDMQIDKSSLPEDNNSMFLMMKKKYEEAGMNSVYKKPYTLPHIVFWNIRSTNGFPSLTTTENTTMMSGNNNVLLNSFCKNGMNGINDMTPWKFLNKVLSNERYDYLGNIVKYNWT